MALPLSVKNLRAFGDRQRPLLEVAELSVEPGTCVGVRGPSGAGKSTLLYALAGVTDRVSGHIRWGDFEISAHRADRRGAFRAASIGMVFQDFLLFEELTAAGNAALAAAYLPKARRRDLPARARTWLDRLGIAETGRGVATFSGGERQRVAVARALAHDPEILLADEPTASLHREAADALVEDLVALVREAGKTLIAVSHDAALLGRMDRVLTMADGRILDDSGARP